MQFIIREPNKNSKVQISKTRAQKVQADSERNSLESRNKKIKTE